MTYDTKIQHQLNGGNGLSKDWSDFLDHNSYSFNRLRKEWLSSQHLYELFNKSAIAQSEPEASQRQILPKAKVRKKRQRKYCEHHHSLDLDLESILVHICSCP